MATNTYVALATTTLTSTTGVVTLSSIPQGYTDLVIVTSPVTDTNGYGLKMRFNGDSNNYYSTTYLAANGSSAISARDSNSTAISVGYYSGVPLTLGTAVSTIHIQNYSNTSTYKTALIRHGRADSETDVQAALYRVTSAITSVSFAVGGGFPSANFLAGSTFTVYGIANADNFVKATGGIISEDSTYTYHVFGSSGTFTPKQSLTADILVVAGGGGGGRDWGAGGGAGGLLGFTGQSLTATGYTVTVGAGGAGYTGGGIGPGSNGADSQFGALTLVKGGGAGGGNQSSGATGGSGGGVGSNGGSRSGGAATSGQGYRGGNTSTLGRTGGGGAGGPGGDNSSDYGNTAGGIGSAAYSSWGAVTGIGHNVSGTYYLAGGGGTGAAPNGGGLGGGGTQAAGTANTGGGGAAEAYAGGSGFVIIRYPK